MGSILNIVPIHLFALIFSVFFAILYISELCVKIMYGGKTMTKQKKLTLLAIAIVLVSCNLRAPFTGVGSMVGLIQEDLGLSGSGAGMLTTIPLLAFAAVSPFVGTLCKKFGAGHVLLMSLLVLIAGIIIRNFGGGMGLYIGTAVVGIGIAVGNVLPPAIIKVYFPNQ